MSRTGGWTSAAALALALGAPLGCRSTELAPPTAQERQLIQSAVQAYIDRAPEAELSAGVADRPGEARRVRVQTVGEPRTLRSRLFVVPARGLTRQDERVQLDFYVLQTGPVFVIDTVVVPASGRRFAP